MCRGRPHDELQRRPCRPVPQPGGRIDDIRTFVALLLDDPVRAKLGAAIERLRPAARGVAWVPPENLHLTLKFLGAVPPARLADVLAALAPAAGGVEPFEAILRGVGAFPTATRPRVIWAGVVGGEKALVALATRVDAALAPLAFAREARPFVPHVTLGRVRVPRRDAALTRALTAEADRDFGRLRLARVSLMRSDLWSRGHRYTELGGVALGAASVSRDIDDPSGRS